MHQTNKGIVCLKCKVHLLTFYIHPTLSLNTDFWHVFYRDTTYFQSFNKFNKGIVYPDTFNVNPVNVSNIPHGF